MKLKIKKAEPVDVEFAKLEVGAVFRDLLEETETFYLKIDDIVGVSHTDNPAVRCLANAVCLHNAAGYIETGESAVFRQDTFVKRVNAELVINDYSE